MTDTKSILILTIFSVPLLFSFSIMQTVWAPTNEPTFYAFSHFKGLSLLHPGQRATFLIKIENASPFSLYDVKPIIDVYPTSSNSLVRIETDTIDVLQSHMIGTIHGTITADPKLPLGELSLSAYFTAKDNNGTVMTGGWSDPSNSLKVESLYLLSPLKQFKSGTDPYFVNCRENLELIIKLRDNSPACVKPTSLARLLQQGWVYAHDNNGKYNRNGKSTNADGLSYQCENEFKPRDLEFTQFPNGTSRTINYAPVFLLKPNSTGKICVNYWRTNPEMDYSGKVMAGIGKINSVVQDVTVVANPDTITLDNTNKTIAYTITTSKESGGFYIFNPMFSDCGGIPVAIGYNSTHSFVNDFPWLSEVLPCPLPVANYQITGLTGIDVAYITTEYR